MEKSCLVSFAFLAVLSFLSTSKAADSCPSATDTLLYACTQPLGIGFVCTNQASSGSAFCCSGCAFCSPGNPCGCMSCTPRPSTPPAPSPSSTTTPGPTTTTTAGPPKPTTPPPPGTSTIVPANGPPATITAPPGSTVIIIPAPATPAPPATG